MGSQGSCLNMRPRPLVIKHHLRDQANINAMKQRANAKSRLHKVYCCLENSGLTAGKKVNCVQLLNACLSANCTGL